MKDRIEGGLLGLLVGDALGVPYEFHQPSEIPKFDQIEFLPPESFSRSHQGVQPGTWSDDGAQALILLDSLLNCGKLDLENFAKGLIAWYETGYMAVDKIVFDVGIQTGKAIRRLKSGVSALEAGLTDEQANGNGSLMRVLPLALWHKGTDAELVNDAHLQSRVTHGHIRSQVCCALYCLWARDTLFAVAQPWQEAVAKLRAIYHKDSKEYQELEWSIRPDDPPIGQGGGYVVDCLRSARLVMQEDTYEKVVKAAISLGRDTDTTACVAGGIAGIRDGITAIPSRWLANLRGKEILQPQLERLIQWRCG
ncbi:MAG: ADP-ribosylglycohydrolase family protein [Acidobacteriota bacterium]